MHTERLQLLLMKWHFRCSMQRSFKKVGDSLAVVINGQKKNLRISGIYSDITNGGKTAKAAFSDHSTDSMWSVVYSTMADPSLVADKRAEYAKTFSFAKVSGIDDYIYQTFGTTIHAIEGGSCADSSLPYCCVCS